MRQRLALPRGVTALCHSRDKHALLGDLERTIIAQLFVFASLALTGFDISPSLLIVAAGLSDVSVSFQFSTSPSANGNAAVSRPIGG